MMTGGVGHDQLKRLECRPASPHADRPVAGAEAARKVVDKT